jgi:hypothetical protein
MSERLVRLRFYTAWSDEREERWLESMARQGWHLERGGICFLFRRGPAAEVRYRLDYRSETGEALRDYLNLCRDAGWENVCRYFNWQYFRTADASAPEIFTDNESKALKYRRLAFLLGALILMNAGAVVSLASAVMEPRPHLWIGPCLQFGLLLLLVYGMVRLLLRIRSLRH